MKKKALIGIVIVAVIGIFVTVGILKNTNGSSEAFSGGKRYEVNVVKIEKGSITSTISANGVVEEKQKSVVLFDSPMKITKLLVEKNQKVTKGQKLLEVDMDALNSEYEQLLTNKVIQQLAMQKLKRSKGISSITENNIKSAESSYNESKKTYEDNLSLYAAEAISQSELDRSKKTMEDAKIALDNARMSMDIDTQTQEQNLKSTILRIADMEQKIEKINQSLVSPSDGVIAEINGEEGGFTSSGMPVIRVVNLGTLQVKAKVSEYNIKSVSVGQVVKITGDAIDKNESITGKVTSISPVATQNMTSNGQETVVEVTVALDQSSQYLKAGLNITCEIETSQKKDVLTVGMEVFDEDKDSNKFVYLVDPKKNTLKKTFVTLGVTSDMQAEVVEGLKEGDQVVLYPQPVFTDGTKVTVLKDDKK